MDRSRGTTVSSNMQAVLLEHIDGECVFVCGKSVHYVSWSDPLNVNPVALHTVS